MTRQELAYAFAEDAGLVPFEEHGRSRGGWDCWGLVYVAYRECLNVELPPYAGGYSSTRNRSELQGVVREAKARNWRELPRDEAPSPWDVVVMRMLGRDCHVGLMLDGHNILHACEGTGAIVEDRRLKPWCEPGQIEGFYQYVLAD